ncbi:hypothetical protein [Novosphingobium profundi]|uniref:hypothetical protein n=1 Tax=Novosphingobium profundi TaxID=1774954 RepID=UPI001CFD4882|nr:hypothetical protein [Novosphingobium profundi]
MRRNVMMGLAFVALAGHGPTRAVAVDREVADALEVRAALSDGLAGALKACRLWVLHPDTWAAGPEPFLKDVGLGDAMGQVRSIAEVNQPPAAWREGNVYWRINSSPDAGYVLVVSHRMPICQVTGGGDADLQPSVGEVLASPEFAEVWREVDEATRGDMVSTTFVSREEPDFTMVLSRADAPGARRDRVQVIASASFAPAGE